jgi:6-phosphofructokinase
MALPIRRIALSTGGGDAPGLNAVIRAATLAALNRGWHVVGIRDGFNGLMAPEEYPDGGMIELTRDRVQRPSPTSAAPSSAPPTAATPPPTRCSSPTAVGWRSTAPPSCWSCFDEQGIDALITIGGDGSLTIGNHLHQAGLRVIGVPKTIDNDLEHTTSTFGFATAVEFATECIDRLFSTATSHGRVIVVEVMGRYAGWIALHAGAAGNAHAILIPEIPFDLEPVAATIMQREQRGAKFSIVVVAEGAVPRGGSVSLVGKSVGQAERLGGIGEKVAAELQRLTGKEARTVVLGHLLRGGSPTSFDRLLGLRFGAAAVRALEDGLDGVMVALDPPTVNFVPLSEVTERQKLVQPDCDTMLTARDIGINFGDAMPTWPSDPA